MPIENNRLFVFSGALSLLFFLLLIVLVFWNSYVSLKPLTLALTKSDVISVSLSETPLSAKTPETQFEEKNVDVSTQEEEIAPKKAVKESQKEEVVPEISDLFSEVKPVKHSLNKKDNSKEISQLDELEKKVLSSKRDSRLQEKAKALDFAKTGIKMMTASSGPEVDEFYAKVQGIVYNNFHPTSGTEGFSARIRIGLDRNGKMKLYKVISYSKNAIFNAEVDWLKERLTKVNLPAHPQGEDVVFEIILSAKD